MGNIIVLALLGVVFYYVFKSYSKYTEYSKEAFKDFSVSYDAIKNSELGLFVALVAKVAKADGKVDALEAQLVGIMFDDGSRLSLGEKAIFVINKFKVKPSTKDYEVDLDLKKGKAIFSSGKIGKLAPEAVKFHIPEGAIGIRGTKFAVEVE